MDLIEFAYGKDFQERMDKVDTELRKIDEKYKAEFQDGDKASFYYLINFSPLRLRWVKDGLPNNIKNEITAVMDRYFDRMKIV